MKRSRLPIVIVMIVGLLLSAVTRDWARSLRASTVEGQPVGDSGAGNSLANMNSFALALLLGGLRGPLVMVLWTSSESQKNERDIEGFDTKVEWIRLLQPEFDTVHIFQVWNKAYNISVQMASLANKYATILDAIDYAQRVEAGRPNNINMVYSIAGIYFDKLGGSSEKAYYRKRVREETLPHATRQKVRKDDPAWRRVELDPMLDKDGKLLPEMLTAKYPRPANQKADEEWNNGAELQYLEAYEPFPYGISTFALSFNYYKRAEVMQNVLKQKHAQLSDLVVDSRPALALKNWGEDEWERGRRAEMKAFNMPVPEEKSAMETPTEGVKWDAPVSDRAAVVEAIDAYDIGSRAGRDALKEYQRHLVNFQVNLGTYQSHQGECQAYATLLSADRDYLKAVLATGAERQALLDSARKQYQQALRETEMVIFRFYIDDELATLAFPAGIRRTNIQDLPTSLYDATLIKIKLASRQRQYDPSAEDRGPHEREVERIMARLALIK